MEKQYFFFHDKKNVKNKKKHVAPFFEDCFEAVQHVKDPLVLRILYCRTTIKKKSCTMWQSTSMASKTKILQLGYCKENLATGIKAKNERFFGKKCFVQNI